MPTPALMLAVVHLGDDLVLEKLLIFGQKYLIAFPHFPEVPLASSTASDSPQESGDQSTFDQAIALHHFQIYAML